DYAGHAAVNALTSARKLWSWGSNNGQMIGGGAVSGSTNAYKDPFTMGRGLDSNDGLIAVETGGHTTVVIRQCNKKYGYIGHKTRGSAGDGDTGSGGNVSNFDFDNTAEVDLCGAPTAPSVQDLEVCPNTYADLNDALLTPTPVGVTVEWYTNAN